MLHATINIHRLSGRFPFKPQFQEAGPKIHPLPEAPPFPTILERTVRQHSQEGLWYKIPKSESRTVSRRLSPKHPA